MWGDRVGARSRDPSGGDDSSDEGGRRRKGERHLDLGFISKVEPKGSASKLHVGWAGKRN